jgi:hypothetical protein
MSRLVHSVIQKLAMGGHFVACPDGWMPVRTSMDGPVRLGAAEAGEGPYTESLAD